MNFRILILALSTFLGSCNSTAQKKNNFTPIPIKEIIEEYPFEIEAIEEMGKNKLWMVYENSSGFKMNQLGEKIARKQLSITFDNDSKFELNENENILFLKKEGVITKEYLLENNSIQSILKRYKIGEDSNLIIKDELRFDSQKYPLKIIGLDTEMGGVLVTDASEGGGERELTFYNNKLEKIQTYSPYGFDYEYSKNFSFTKEVLIAFIPFFGEKIPLKFATFDFNQQKISNEILIELDRTDILNVECSEDLIVISYTKGNDYFLSTYDKTGNNLWVKKLAFPANQIDILSDRIIFRGMDLNIYLFDKNNGHQINHIDLLNLYPFPIEYNKYGLAVSFFDIQLNHTAPYENSSESFPLPIFKR